MRSHASATPTPLGASLSKMEQARVVSTNRYPSSLRVALPPAPSSKTHERLRAKRWLTCVMWSAGGKLAPPRAWTRRFAITLVAIAVMTLRRSPTQSATPKLARRLNALLLHANRKKEVTHGL